MLALAASSRGVAQSAASARTVVGLGGEWRFAIDPTNNGETDTWFAPELDDRRWDRVDVPHCWPLDPRYQYTGRAWYRRTFESPARDSDQHVRLEFGAVFARARVWLNGVRLGTHEGGYTPFGFDVTTTLAAGISNVLVLEVDNSWSTTTLPGARPGADPSARVYPWWDYGGIVRTPTLVVSPAVYVEKQRVTATPDLASGTAGIEATVWLRNTTPRQASSQLRLSIVRLDDGREVPIIAPGAALQTRADTRGGETRAVTVRGTLPRDAVRLWDLDRPTLYRLRAELTTDPARVDVDVATFGIRRFDVRGTELHLNGRAVRLGGANRASDDPKFGLIEPADVVERDLRLMKAAGMELQRIIHYAAAPALLDVADRLGILIIGEAGNWQLKPSQMDSPAIRADFQNQTREMIERDWNHPSVVAWSVGNEYESQTPAGVRWTKDMTAFVRSIDPSRPVTFASFKADRAEVVRPEDEGSHYVDFVSVNMYGPANAFADRLDLVHRRWPDKPVFISEFGLRADKVRDEREREMYFRDVMAAIRPRKFVAGASVWTFNDYRSRYPDTASNGYRPWGLVDEHRVPRSAYRVVAGEFAAARVVARPVSHVEGRLVARASVEARADFPARALSGLTLQMRSTAAGRVVAVRQVPDLLPGQRVELVLEGPAVVAAETFSIELVRLDGSVMDRAGLSDRGTATETGPP